MKKLLCILSLFLLIESFGQSLEKSKNSDLYKQAPEWAKLMYTQNPNVNEVDKLYVQYFNSNKYQKSYHTQYYKRWKKAISPYLNDEGFFDINKKTQLATIIANLQTNSKKEIALGGTWKALGPFRNPLVGGVVQSGAQANVYSIGQCKALPNIMYCGTEPGEVYKSIDGANTWFNVSKNLVTAYTDGAVTGNAGISALAVHPTNPDIVYIGSSTEVFKTIDGGNNWISIYNSQIPIGGYLLNPAEIYINPNNPEIVFVAGEEGIYRTNNGGVVWSQVVADACYDIKAKPGNPNILYTIKNNPVSNTHQFLKSIDAGITWIPQTAGWYNSTSSNRTVGGARIAVTEADSNRIYAFLIGDSKSGDNGFIGIYRSNDGGQNWTNTMGYDGGPYIANTHPNLISNSPVTIPNSFNQGFYNCTIMASNTNADEILVGGIGMHKSIDGGQTFECKYNYVCGNISLMHVDQQDYRAFGNEYWATTDGGIYKSKDLFTTQPEFKMDGVRAVDFWGFGSGWNRDILVGGTFHNGVDAFAEGFPDGDFLHLVDGEPQSGYVSPSNQSRIYSNNLGSKILPQTITGAVLSAPYEATLNETPWFAESSELEFHPSCYNYVYKGYQNKLYKSVDGGASFTAIYAAGQNTTVLGIEISRKNTNTMFIVVRPTSGTSYIKKTTDNWITNTTINLPNGGNNLAIISLDPENDQIIWLAYPRGDNGNKVFKSINSGLTWSNQTSSSLDAQNIQAMTTIGGTNGGVYVATNLTCYYKNNNMISWVTDNSNLPTSIGTIGIKPFYRDGKIRIASLGKGIWESTLFEAPTRPAAKIMVDKLSADLLCNNTFNFDDYSMLNHTNATWAWTFQDANIATSSLRNPQVSFNSLGNHLITLTVTNDAGISSTDTLIVTIVVPNLSQNLNQNFELEFLPTGWFQDTSANIPWSYNDQVGGFGLSTKCMTVNNFIVNEPNAVADIIAEVDLTNLTAPYTNLTFDLAYSYFGGIYQDGLQILVSTDCGLNYTMLYDKKGQQLATAPQYTTQFIPTDSEWRNDSVNLSNYIGNPDVFIKFRNINQFGQALYLDNIKFGDATLNTVTFKDSPALIFPNPVSNQSFITVKSDQTSEIKFNLFNISGKLIDTVFTKFNTPIAIDKYNLAQGIYFYKIISEDKILTGKLIVSNRN